MTLSVYFHLRLLKSRAVCFTIAQLEKLMSRPRRTLFFEKLHNSYTHGTVCECVWVCLCVSLPPVIYGHMVQSCPILGRQGEEESRSKEGGICVVLHQILAADKCLLPFTDPGLTFTHLGMTALCVALCE